MKVKKQDLIRKVNASLIHHLEFEEEHEVFEMPFDQLVNPARFDVLMKYIYANFYRHGYDLRFATEMYAEHLKVWGNLIEGDLTGKDSLSKYLEAFNQMLKRFAIEGFDRQTSYLPVGSNDIIIDGAHRSAACLAYQSNPLVARFNHAEADYGAQFFQGRGLSPEYLDAAATEYASIAGNSYIVSLFPIAGDKKPQVDDVLADFGRIVYEKPVSLHHFGPVNVLAQMYKAEHWLGEREDGWPGAIEHAKNKFCGKGPMYVYLYECESLPRLIEAKEKIRDLFPFGNDSIHINDSHEETVRMAQQLFNRNTLHLFNHGDLSKCRRVFALHEIFKEDICKKGYAAEKFCVDSSSVLSLYGLREAADYDYLNFHDNREEFSHHLINNHNHEVKHYGADIGRLIFDPRHYLYYDGIKYSSLQTVLEMKQNRSEEKDIIDLNLAAPIVRESADEAQWIPLHRKIKHPLGRRIKRAVAGNLPGPVLALARRILGLARDISTTAQSRLHFLGPGGSTMQYQGFSLHYSRGTSLVQRIKNGQIYEPDVTTAIIRQLQSCHQAVILDIGANIGLVSLNILEFYPGAKIYAFEPGAHQRKLFQKTIQANQLADQIELSEIALSDANGMSEFSMHSTAHASGDGFRDTNRAGKTLKTMVRTQRLDDWWLAKGKPDVDFVKMDTEGSELMILRGATEFLDNQRPVVLLEINALNLRVYDYDHLDVLNFLTGIKYGLETLDGYEVHAENIENHMSVCGEFFAKPKPSNTASVNSGFNHAG